MSSLTATFQAGLPWLVATVSKSADAERFCPYRTIFGWCQFRPARLKCDVHGNHRGYVGLSAGSDSEVWGRAWDCISALSTDHTLGSEGLERAAQGSGHSTHGALEMWCGPNRDVCSM